MVVTNNYRASGNFPGVRNASENRQVLINYITAVKTINPTADQNWGFTDAIKGLDIHFRTAEWAKDLLCDRSSIQFVASDPSNKGFGDFKYIYSDQINQAQDLNPKSQEVKGQEVSSQASLSLEQRQAILQMVTENDQALQNQPTSSKNAQTTQSQLPKTASQSGWLLSLLGLLISTFAASLLPKSNTHKNQN